MPPTTNEGKGEEKDLSYESHERVITLNLTFLDFAVLVGCLEAAKQPFMRKVNDGLELKGMEEPTLEMIISLGDLVHEQAKLSTSNLGADRVVRGLQLYSMANESFAATYTNVLREIFLK